MCSKLICFGRVTSRLNQWVVEKVTMMHDGFDSTSPHLRSSCLGGPLLSSKTDMPSSKAWLHPDSVICFLPNPYLWTRRNAASKYWKFSAWIAGKQNIPREWSKCQVSRAASEEVSEIETNFCEAATTTAGQACLHEQWNQRKDWTPGATNNPYFKRVATRHDICQNVYATGFWGARILRRKRVNCDISQFATKARKCSKMAKFVTKECGY